MRRKRCKNFAPWEWRCMVQIFCKSSIICGGHMVQKCPRAATHLAKRSQIVIGECTLLSMLSSLHHHSPFWYEQTFSDLQYVMLGICKSPCYDICWFGVARILNYSHSEKNFSWSLPDNLFILLVVIYLFGTWAIRSEPVSCLCVSALFVLNCLFGNSTIQKHYFMELRWGVSVCICLVCICLNIPCSAWN